MMRLLKIKWIPVVLLVITALIFSPIRTTHAYYGGLYGSGVYGGGGLYGMSGLGGMYGMSGLGGMYGMSGLGGLYGMSGLGGMYGMSGLGGLYGMSGLGGLSYLSSGIEALTRAADILISGTIPIVGVGGGLSILPTATTPPSVTVSIPVYPDPSGLYLGTWTSLSFSTSSSSSILNNMTMNLLYNPFDGIITGTAGLLLNKLIPIEIPVAGLNNAPSFILAGTFFDPISLETFSLELACTFSTLITTLPAIIQGTYLIHDPLYTRLDWGIFSTGRL